MESPAATPFFLRHKLLSGLVLAIAIPIYTAFIVWVYQYAKNNTASSSQTRSEGLKESSSADSSSVIPAKAESQSAITPTPTPRPTGPGQYACDQYGVCNNYEESKRTACPKTYADRTCLDECQKKDVQCPK